MDRATQRRKRQIAKRQAVDKLDLVAVSVFGAIALFMSNYIEAHTLTKLAQIAILIALFAHYLSLETEVAVVQETDKSPNIKANEWTGKFNKIRRWSLSMGFVLLLITVIISLF